MSRSEDNHISFHKMCDILASSSDPAEAWKGRISREIFECWTRHLNDTRGAPAIDVLATGTKMLALLLAQLAVSCGKPGNKAKQKVTRLVVDAFVREFATYVNTLWPKH